MKLKHTLIVALTLLTAATVAAAPAYATDGPAPAGTVEKTEPAKTEPAKTEPAKPAEPAKPTCSADELAAFLASVKAEAAKQGHHNKQGADRASGRAAEEQARAARKAAQACAVAKQHAAEVARKAAEEAKQEANRKARARKFQAIGVVDVTDGTAGTVTVFIKAGSPDLHSRKLAIKVTADTVIQLDGNTVALAGLVSGTFVSVHGVRTEGTLVAARINAATPGVDDEHDVAPTVAPSPEPTAAPETK